MSYETIPVEMKDSGTVHVLTGTVTDTGDGIVDLDIDGHGNIAEVPVFYHCPNEETADGMPFFGGERVVVVNTGDIESLSVADMKVVGFEDGLPRDCGWRFKLTRGDETLITEESNLSLTIQVYNSEGDWINITTPIYHPVPKTGEDTDGYWSFEFVNLEEDKDENGYWVRYWCDDGVWTQYPYAYKYSETEQAEDLIHMGAYEDIIPYWSGEAYTYSPEPSYILSCPPVWDLYLPSEYLTQARWINSFTMSTKIYSSIPYRVTYRVASRAWGKYFFRPNHNCDDPNFYCLEGSIAKFRAVGDGALSYLFETDTEELGEATSGFYEGNVEGTTHLIDITTTDSSDETQRCWSKDEYGNYTVENWISRTYMYNRLKSMSISFWYGD